MAKLVLLSAGMTGRTHDLKVEKTTIGRVEDNTVHLAEPSVSSHHCEVLLRGDEVVVRDLNSTNGTFINGEKITESVLKPGEVLRLGQIEMRLEGDSVAGGGTPAPMSHTPSSSGSGSSKKQVDHTMVMQRGVKLDELEQGARPAGFDTAGKGFSKKDNKVNKIFLIVGVSLGVVIALLLIYAFTSAK
jgi:pSer/pThr/pTyr-binding forkhead associated (FHA) protein